MFVRLFSFGLCCFGCCCVVVVFERQIDEEIAAALNRVAGGWRMGLSRGIEESAEPKMTVSFSNRSWRTIAIRAQGQVRI